MVFVGAGLLDQLAAVPEHDCAYCLPGDPCVLHAARDTTPVARYTDPHPMTDVQNNAVTT